MISQENRQKTVLFANDIKQELDILIMKLSAGLRDEDIIQTVSDIVVRVEDIYDIWEELL